MRISIIQGNVNGQEVYSEIHTPLTNANGLISIAIGEGETEQDMANIDWSEGPYFIKTETDPEGGNNYSITGISQLLSVPYAFHAQTADSLTNEITESDPLFNASVAAAITGSDTIYWNNKLDGFTETDPLFTSSLAASISPTDTANWNHKLDSFTETDPLFNGSTAAGISQADTAYWNNKPDGFTETDPIFNSSLAAAITPNDTTTWNHKSDFDGNYSSLTNAPDIANTVEQKNIQLNADNTSSSFGITNSSGSNVFKVDGSGKMTGDGSGLANTRSLIAFAQGNQEVFFEEGLIPGLNANEAQILREVTINCPGPGIVIAQATGYCKWQSENKDLARIWFFPQNSYSYDWQTPDYNHLAILDDHGCTSIDDIYSNWGHSKVYIIENAQAFTVKIAADKFLTDSKFSISDVNMQLIFIPTGGTGQKNNEIPAQDNTKINAANPNSIDGN